LKILKTFVKTKTKTFLFVPEAPRDQDFGLEDYITDIDIFISPVHKKSTKHSAYLSVRIVVVHIGL